MIIVSEVKGQNAYYNVSVILDLLTAIAGQLSGAGFSIRLFVDNILPSAYDTIATFTEPTFTGYAPASGSGTTHATISPDGAETPLGGANVFKATADPTLPVTVYGWFITDTLGTQVMASGLFDAPFTFSRNGDGFNLIFGLTLSYKQLP